MERILAGLVQRLWRLGWGVLFIPVTLLALLAFSLLGLNPLTLIAAIVAVIMVFRAPALARDLVPALLAGLGLWGGWLGLRSVVIWQRRASFGLAGPGWWQSLLLLALGLGLLAAGLWLAPRTGLYRRCREAVRRVSWREPGWGVLLIPLAAAGFGLFGFNTWTVGFAVFAVVAALLLPDLAADLVPFGLILLGLYAIRLPSLASRPRLPKFLEGSWVAVRPAVTRAQLQQAVQLRQHAAALLNQATKLQQQAFGLLKQAAALQGGALQGRVVLKPGARFSTKAAGVQVQLSGPKAGLVASQGKGFVAAASGSMHISAVASGPPVVAVPVVPPGASGMLKLPSGMLAMRLKALPGLPPAHVWYGFVQVGMPYWAALAAAEAVLFVAFGLWLVPRTLAPHAQVGVRYAALERRVRRLAQTRTDAVDAAASELRRVERDLHDGAQARLVAVGMSLRAAERTLEQSPGAALALIAEARESSARALADLRNLVRGIHPPVLADRGLGDAIRALALDTPLRTDLDIDLPGRPEAPVETAAYFAVAEVIANAVKHAGARRLEIRVQHHRGVLRIMVSDDGAGGADPDKGTGLRGVERRLAAFDGILAVSSPPGGPTIVAIEVPCALSSPKTFSC